MKSPFKFLDPYTARDHAYFFGREEETDELYELVFQTQLLLILGMSGTGKTSLVQCGLANRFESTDWLPYFIRRGQNINENTLRILRESLPEDAALEEGATLTECVQELYYHALRPIYLIFDQFEEVFTLNEDVQQREAEQRAFAESIRQLLASEVDCKVIIIMREEYLAKLYDLEKILTTIYDFRLRVEPMGARKIRQVLEGSFDRFNIRVRHPEEDFEAIYGKLSAGKFGIQLPHLQVYLDMLYREDFARTYPELVTPDYQPEAPFPELEFTPEEIEDFDSIDKALTRFMSDQEEAIARELRAEFGSGRVEIVQQILDLFVAESGTKRPLAFRRTVRQKALRLADSSLVPRHIPVKQIAFVLDKLLQSRLLRERDGLIELAHDSLAQPIDARRSDQQRRYNEVKVRLQNQYEMYQITQEFATARQLDFYKDYLPHITISGRIERFLEDSEKHIAAEERRREAAMKAELERTKERLAREQRDKEAILVQMKRAEQAEQDAAAKMRRALAAECAFRARMQNDRTVAFRLLEIGYLIDPDNARVRELLIDNYHVVEEFGSFQVPYHRSFCGFFDSVYTIACLPEKKLIAAGSKDAIIRIVTLDSFRECFRLEGHTRRISALTFLPLSGHLASVSHDRRVIIWELENGTIQAQRQLDGRALLSLAVSPDGKFLVVGSRDGKVTILHVGTLEICRQFDLDQPINGLDFRNDNELLAIGCGNGQIVLRSAFTWEPAYELNSESQVNDIHFSPDGNSIAVACQDYHVRIFDLRNEQHPVEVLAGHGASVESVRYSPEGAYLLTASADRTCLIWSVNTKEQLLKLEGHTDQIYSAIFSRDEQYILTASRDRSFKRWDFHAKVDRQLDVLAGHGTYVVTDATFSPDGRLAISAGRDNSVKVWEIGARFNEIDSFREHLDVVNGIAVSPDGKYLVSVSSDHTAIIWDKQTKQPAVHLKDHESDVLAVDYAPDGAWIATAEFGLPVPEEQRFAAKIILRKGPSGEPVHTLTGHEKTIYAIRFSPDSQWLVSASWDKTIRVWKVSTGEQYTLIPCLTAVLDACFSNDGTRIIAAGQDHIIRIYQTEDAKEISTLSGHSSAVTCVACIPDTQLLISGCEDGIIKVWDMETGEETMNLHGSSSAITRVDCVRSYGYSRLLYATHDRLYLRWLEPEAIFESMQALNVAGELTAAQIDQFSLESLFSYTDFIDGAGGFSGVIATKNEERIFNLAVYYLNKYHQTSNHHKKENYRDWSKLLFEAGRELSDRYLPATYDQFLDILADEDPTKYLNNPSIS